MVKKKRSKSDKLVTFVLTLFSLVSIIGVSGFNVFLYAVMSYELQEPFVILLLFANLVIFAIFTNCYVSVARNFKYD